jgi:lactate dehydrogenase-like 2-hydroxyacid dehydrogenase
VAAALEEAFVLHRLGPGQHIDAFPADVAREVVALALTGPSAAPRQFGRIDAALMDRFPKLACISTFGVGFEHIDVAQAAARGIIVTNTPGVHTEEVADTTLGLLLCTVRELPQAMRHLQQGRWPQGSYRLSPTTLRGRTIGMVGMGRIGQAIARRIEAFGLPIVYHARRPNAGVPYRHYPKLTDMARDVDTLIVIVPGGPETRHLVNAEVLDALGPDGVLVNVARGSVVDEAALVAALRDRRIMAAGLDVFEREPHVPQELIDMDNVVLFPHVGSASVATRAAMDRLLVDNLLSWARRDGPLTPVNK